MAEAAEPEGPLPMMIASQFFSRVLAVMIRYFKQLADLCQTEGCVRRFNWPRIERRRLAELNFRHADLPDLHAAAEHHAASGGIILRMRILSRASFDNSTCPQSG